MSTAEPVRALRRSYDQGCGIAAGLDLIGERWSLLLIRELLIQPARFNDLLENLQGISPNLLTERLRFLQSTGLITRHLLDADGRGRVYFLTERGEALRPTILELAKWGLANAEDHIGSTRPEWAGLAMEAMARGRTLSKEISEIYCFRIDDFILYIMIDSGIPRFSTTQPLIEPSVIIHSSASTMIRIGMKRLDPLTALSNQKIAIEGSMEAFLNCGHLLGLMPDPPTPLPPSQQSNV